MEEDLDKTVLYINSRNSHSNSNSCSYIYDLIEPLKDIVYIKTIRTEVFAKHSQFSDGEPLFLKLNDYKRLSTVIDGNATKFFESISINISDKSTDTLSNEIVSFQKNSMSSFHKCDPNVYEFKPIESNIKSFNIEIYDQNNTLLDKTAINGFNMTICIYHRYRKISQF